MKPGSAVRQAGIYGLIVALGAALLFHGLAAFLGGYPAVARYGGAAWVFLLTWIITMPVLAPLLKNRT